MAISQTVALDAERSLHLIREGDGLPIVLIHGALATHVDWLEAPLAAFAQRGLALAVDRPGHGSSARPRYDATPLAQARQIRAGLTALGVDVAGVRLVGHSFGGMVAMTWAAAWPEEVRSLLLLSPITRPEFRVTEHLMLGPRALPVFGPVIAEVARWSLDPVLLKMVQKLMFSPGQPPVDWLERYPAEVVLRPSQMVQEGEDAATLTPGSLAGLVDIRAIRCPVALVSGMGDKIVEHRQHAALMAAVMPQAALTLVEGIGHMPHHQALDQVLAAFDGLSAQEPASTAPAQSAERPSPA
ncbi:alpha/beta hydrolase [Phenylobacterium sp.]|jgi:pimeloyl-ACP methyl ester carboxylesterase|uniref:alpha/beta fold hydrolase n=1 Tax=Phenylobacterium sp. TaxID=1871053 RepID=UPI002F946D57